MGQRSRFLNHCHTIGLNILHRIKRRFSVVNPLHVEVGLWLWYYLAGFIAIGVLIWQACVYLGHHKIFVGGSFIVLALILLFGMALSTYGSHLEMKDE